MTRESTSYTDRAGRRHDTLEAAIRSDLATVLGSPAYAAKVLECRVEVVALLGEIPASKVVQIGAGRKG